MHEESEVKRKGIFKLKGAGKRLPGPLKGYVYGVLRVSLGIWPLGTPGQREGGSRRLKFSYNYHSKETKISQQG